METLERLLDKHLPTTPDGVERLEKQANINAVNVQCKTLDQALSRAREILKRRKQ